MRVLHLVQKNEGDGHVDSNKPKVQEMRVRIKVVAAAIGAGVIVTMGALTMALSGNEANGSTAALGGAGNTSTQGTPPPTLATPVAVPTQTAHRWAPGIWQ